MRKIWVIAGREYNASVRTKSFIVSLVLMPVLMGGGILVQSLLKGDLQKKEFKIVDRTGKLRPLIEAANDQLGKTAGYRGTAVKDSGDAIHPFKITWVTPSKNDPAQINAQRYALSQEVRDGNIFGFAEIGREITDPTKPNSEQAKSDKLVIRYQTNSPTYQTFSNWLELVVSQATKGIRAQQEKVEPETFARIMPNVPLITGGLTIKNAKGQYEEAELPNAIITIIVPLVLIMLMFMVIMVGATPLMQGIVEEKMQRIAEVLLGSVRPFDLMMGKLVGMVGVALTLVAVYMTGLYWLASYYGYADILPIELLVWFFVYQILAVLMYGSLFIAVGAACTDIKETQTMLMPVMLLVCIPMFVWFNVVREPNSPFSMWISLFPPAAPMLMVARLAVPPGIPWWEPVVGVLGVLLTTLACVYAAGRIFRVGILMQGKAAKVTDLVRWVFRG